MSNDVFPLAVWQSGTLNNSLPANDNSLRLEAILRGAISKSVTAQPGSPTDRDVYIIPAGVTGTQWATFAENDIAIFVAAGGGGGTWLAVSPVERLAIFIDDHFERFDGAAWIELGGSVTPVVAASGTSLAADETNAGNYTRFTNAGAKTYTFDSAESYAVGSEYHGRNIGAGDLTITEAGSFTVNAPAGGTLIIPQGGTFTVKIVASNEADLFGVTEAA